MKNSSDNDGKPPPNKGPVRQNQQNKPERPAHEVRYGRVKAAIWLSTSNYRLRFSVKVSKVYKTDDSDEWQTTDVFFGDDLLLLAKVIDLAHTWIYENGTPEGIPF